MIDRPLKVAVVGACHLDRKAQSDAPYVPAASNPVQLRSCPGGVARNLAENLCRLGVEVELVTRLGRDAEGDMLLSGLGALPIGRTGISRSQAAPTAFHLIAVQPDGETMLALADMRIYDEITPELLNNLPESLWEADAIVADCNLAAETLDFLAGLRRDGRKLAFVAVSPAKVVRLRPRLAACDLLCVNLREAAALLDWPPEPVDPVAAATALTAQGVGEAVITLGAMGICLADGAEALVLRGIEGSLRDVTGAGDALAAVFLAARLRGLGLAAAGRRALAAARLTVESEDSVSPRLTPQILEELAP